VSRDKHADEGLTREEYFDERKMLIEARQRGYQRAEQIVMGGATGALLLSVTFLEKLVPNGHITRAWLLWSAWVVLLVCLGISLFGQYASAKAFDCELVCLDGRTHKKPVPKNRWLARNAFCGGSSSVLLVVGIFGLALFAYLNAPFR
jgi:hypothetical protein